MKRLYSIYLILFISLLSACGGPLVQKAPQTLPEKLAAMEISYGEFLDIVALYKSEGRLNDSDMANLKAIDNKFNVAKTAAYVAINVGDLSTAEAKYTAALLILTELREYVK